MNTVTDSRPPADGHAAAALPPPDWTDYKRVSFLAAVVGFAAWAVVGGMNYGMAPNHEAGIAQFFLSLEVGFVYWISLPVGGMALLFIHYLAKSSWGYLLKRPFEAATRTLPLFFALFIALAVGSTLGKASPFWWSAPEAQHVEHAPLPPPTPAGGDKRDEAIKAGKTMMERAVLNERSYREHGTLGFLSVPAFFGVGVFLFAVWGTFIYFLNKWGAEADRDVNVVSARLETLKNMSGPWLITYALTITAAATQWVMSLEPGWASTMFPVIFAVNQFLTCFAFCLAIFLTIATRPPVAGVLRDKFQLDMGTLMLAFTLLWSYTSFSQYMLVWIGNLPEEIPFYLKRSDGGWWWISAAMIVFHFALPFMLLLFRDIKLHPKKLRVVAVYLLVICAIDVTWWIEPAKDHEGQYLFWVMDVAALAGVGGLFGLYFFANLAKRPLLPANELYQLPEGHAHDH